MWRQTYWRHSKTNLQVFIYLEFSACEQRKDQYRPFSWCSDVQKSPPDENKRKPSLNDFKSSVNCFISLVCFFFSLVLWLNAALGAAFFPSDLPGWEHAVCGVIITWLWSYGVTCLLYNCQPCCVLEPGRKKRKSYCGSYREENQITLQ